MDKLTLYHTCMSSPCRAVVLLIRELGLDINLEHVDFANLDNLSDDYLRMNPQHTVPLLNDNGYYLWESKAIMIYLINKYAKNSPLFPRDAKTNATLMQRLFFDHETFDRLRDTLAALCLKPEKGEMIKLKLDFHHRLDFMEKFLEAKKWFVGNEPTIVDLCILATLSTIYYCGFSLDDYPNLLKFYENCKMFKGYDENQEGAPMLGHHIREKIPEGF